MLSAQSFPFLDQNSHIIVKFFSNGKTSISLLDMLKTDFLPKVMIEQVIKTKVIPKDILKALAKKSIIRLLPEEWPEREMFQYIIEGEFSLYEERWFMHRLSNYKEIFAKTDNVHVINAFIDYIFIVRNVDVMRMTLKVLEYEHFYNLSLYKPHAKGTKPEFLQLSDLIALVKNFYNV